MNESIQFIKNEFMNKLFFNHKNGKLLKRLSIGYGKY